MQCAKIKLYLLSCVLFSWHTNCVWSLAAHDMNETECMSGGTKFSISQIYFVWAKIQIYVRGLSAKEDPLLEHLKLFANHHYFWKQNCVVCFGFNLEHQPSCVVFQWKLGLQLLQTTQRLFAVVLCWWTILCSATSCLKITFVSKTHHQQTENALSSQRVASCTLDCCLKFKQKDKEKWETLTGSVWTWNLWSPKAWGLQASALFSGSAQTNQLLLSWSRIVSNRTWKSTKSH